MYSSEFYQQKKISDTFTSFQNLIWSATFNPSPAPRWVSSWPSRQTFSGRRKCMDSLKVFGCLSKTSTLKWFFIMSFSCWSRNLLRKSTLWKCLFRYLNRCLLSILFVSSLTDGLVLRLSCRWVVVMIFYLNFVIIQVWWIKFC